MTDPTKLEGEARHEPELTPREARQGRGPASRPVLAVLVISMAAAFAALAMLYLVFWT